METLKKVLKQANIISDLKLFVKREGGGTQSTGPHTVKLIDSKIIKGTDFNTKKDIFVVRLLLEENGEQKKYDFPMKDQKGDVHYLVQRLAEFKEGSEVILEGKNQGGRSFTDVQSTNAISETSEENVPTVNIDDSISDDDIPIIEEPTTEGPSTEEENEDEIKISDIPF